MLLTAIFMGIAGSLHCAGMCSPLAFAVTRLRGPALTNRLLYNLGRIATYGLLGGMAATIGYILPLSGFQTLLSAVMGAILILAAVVGLANKRIPVVTNMMLRVTGMLKVIFSRHISGKSSGTLLLLGALNGLLPCGLTYLALSFCITLASPLDGATYMVAFGTGTLPVMLGLVSITDVVKNRMKWNAEKLTAGLMIISGALLIARVFILHIPDSHPHELDLIDVVICR